MNTLFVNKRSEVTTLMDAQMASGSEAYRTRMDCQCMFPKNRRSGVLVLKDGILTLKVIRCKACTKKHTHV